MAGPEMPPTGTLTLPTLLVLKGSVTLLVAADEVRVTPMLE